MVSLAATLTVAGSLSAQVIAADAFAAPATRALAGATGGQGWGSAWNSVGPADAPAATLLAGDSLVMTGLMLASRPGVAQLLTGPGADAAYRRTLGTALTPAGGPFWIAVAIQTLGRGEAALSVGLLDAARDSLFDLRFALGSNYGDGTAIVDGVGRYPRSLGTSVRRARWLVAQVFPLGGERWRAYAWTDVDPAAPAPDTAGAASRDFRFTAGGFDAVELRFDGLPGASARLDDIRVGRAFADVASPDWRAAVGAPVTAARDDFAYVPGIALAGAGAGSGWGGPWRLVGGASPRTDTARFRFGAYDTTVVVSGARLVLGAGEPGGRIARDFVEPYPLTESGEVLWAGAILEVELGTASRNVASVIFTQSGFAPTGPGGQPVLFGKGFDSDRVSIGPPQRTRFGPGPIAAPHFLAVRVERGAGGVSAPDRAWLFVDPPLDSLPPALSTAQSIVDVDLGSGISGLGLKIEGQGPLAAFVGALAAAETYAAVRPRVLLPAGASSLAEPVVPRTVMRVWPQPVSSATQLQVAHLTPGVYTLRLSDVAGRELSVARFDAVDLRGGVALEGAFGRAMVPGGLHTLSLYRGPRFLGAVKLVR